MFDVSSSEDPNRALTDRVLLEPQIALVPQEVHGGFEYNMKQDIDRKEC